MVVEGKRKVALVVEGNNRNVVVVVLVEGKTYIEMRRWSRKRE